jgi:diadenosine tetraphosphate (Ap4A) HIT family hydrolase
MKIDIVEEPYNSIPSLKTSHDCPTHIQTRHNQTNYSTVFGRIIRGQSPAAVPAESQDLLAFKDIRPWVPLHALIIPKDESIASVYDLHVHRHHQNAQQQQQQQDSDSPDDADNLKNNNDDNFMMRRMQNMAEELVKYHQPDAYKHHDYIICYHIPPFTKVKHLHLHVLTPASQLSWIGKKWYFRYETRW